MDISIKSGKYKNNKIFKVKGKKSPTRAMRVLLKESEKSIKETLSKFPNINKYIESLEVTSDLAKGIEKQRVFIEVLININDEVVDSGALKDIDTIYKDIEDIISTSLFNHISRYNLWNEKLSTITIVKASEKYISIVSLFPFSAVIDADILYNKSIHQAKNIINTQSNGLDEDILDLVTKFVRKDTEVESANIYFNLNCIDELKESIIIEFNEILEDIVMSTILSQ